MWGSKKFFLEYLFLFWFFYVNLKYNLYIWITRYLRLTPLLMCDDARWIHYKLMHVSKVCVNWPDFELLQMIARSSSSRIVRLVWFTSLLRATAWECTQCTCIDVNVFYYKKKKKLMNVNCKEGKFSYLSSTTNFSNIYFNNWKFTFLNIILIDRYKQTSVFYWFMG